MWRLLLDLHPDRGHGDKIRQAFGPDLDGGVFLGLRSGLHPEFEFGLTRIQIDRGRVDLQTLVGCYLSVTFPLRPLPRTRLIFSLNDSPGFMDSSFGTTSLRV